MSDEDFNEYVDMIASMSVDYKLGGIDRANYTSNIVFAVKKLVGDE